MVTECGTIKCPPVRNTVYLSTKDLNGRPTAVSYIETHNIRTGKKEVNLQNSPNYTGGETYRYKLFYNIRDFSFSGDNVLVLVRSQSGKEYILDYTIKGGNCACEVEKVSGVSELVVE